MQFLAIDPNDKCADILVSDSELNVLDKII